ncbi:MAG: alanine racemase [Clostridia bacterium]|nr:alanine racemase [Clostridia bacterium]
MPRLLVDLKHIRRNAGAVCGFCAGHGISVAGVVKGACGAIPVARAVLEGGCAQLASSRLSQLEDIRAAIPGVPTLLIRMPAPEEADRVVRACDLSLNTEEGTLRALSAAAQAAGVTHGVILMFELGDLREGVASREELCRLASLAERLPGIRLAGIGGTLNDIYGVSPSTENMAALVSAFHAAEEAVGRKLDILSGGSTTSLPMLLQGQLPREINHLRIGEAILTGRDLPDLWGTQVPGCGCDTLLLEATLIEHNAKPTRPWGLRSQNGFGEQPPLPPDRGIRQRAILNVGRCDVGEVSQLICPEGISVIGASSDHLVVDVQDHPGLQVGDSLGFRLFYQGMLFAFQSEDVEKVYIE